MQESNHRGSRLIYTPIGGELRFMSLKIDCDFCGEELNKPGALLFSPPMGELETCFKHHMCKSCWRVFWFAVHQGMFKVMSKHVTPSEPPPPPNPSTPTQSAAAKLYEI